MKKICLFFVFVMLFVCFIGCNDLPQETIKLSDFVIEECDNLEIGDTHTFVVSYDNKADVDFEWSTSDGNIISVENGKITAIAAGTATITLKDKVSGLEKKVTVTVNKKEEVKQELTEEIKKLFDDFVKELPKTTVYDLPLLEGYNVSYVFDSNIDENGKITREDDSVEVSGKVVLTVGEEKIEKDYTVSVTGTFIDDVANEFLRQFGVNGFDGKTSINKRFDDYGGTFVIWSSENEEVLTSQGKVTRPFNDTYVNIKYTVKTKDPVAEATYTAKVLVLGEELSVKNKVVEEWICKSVPENSILYPGDVLPEVCETYGATITWLDENDQKPDLGKLAQDPILGDAVVLTVRVVYENSDNYLDFVLDYRVWNKKYENDWEKIDDFVKALSVEKVRAYEYWMQGYDVINMGYVPFYENKNADINTDYFIEEASGYVRTGIKQKSTEYVTIHDTAGALPTHTALSFAQNQLQKNNNTANREYISWHFTVGEDGIYQSLPLDEVAYHAGDGSREYGTIWYNSTYDKDDCIGGGNRNSIGIESCINYGSDYNVTLRVLAKLVAELLLDNNLSVDRVKQHNDFSGKDCPGVIRHCRRWDEFLDLVKIEYFAKTELQDVEFVWESLTPSILDNTGKVLKKGGTFEVSYKVTVTLNGTSKEYTGTSKVVEEDKIELGDW